jgi:hypothetical protein
MMIIQTLIVPTERIKSIRRYYLKTIILISLLVPLFKSLIKIIPLISKILKNIKI